MWAAQHSTFPTLYLSHRDLSATRFCTEVVYYTHIDAARIWRLYITGNVLAVQDRAVRWSTLPFELHITFPTLYLSHQGLSATHSYTEFVYSQPNCRVTGSVPAPQWGQAQRSKKAPEKSREGASETAELNVKIRRVLAVEVLDAAMEHHGQIRGEDKRRRFAAGRHGSAPPLSSGKKKKTQCSLPDFILCTQKLSQKNSVLVTRLFTTYSETESKNPVLDFDFPVPISCYILRNWVLKPSATRVPLFSLFLSLSNGVRHLNPTIAIVEL